jgi:hypothetical protein
VSQSHQTQQQFATDTKGVAGGEASVDLFGKKAAKVNVGGYAVTREVKHGKATVVEETEDEEEDYDDYDDDEGDGDDDDEDDNDADEGDEDGEEEGEESNDE